MLKYWEFEKEFIFIFTIDTFTLQSTMFKIVLTVIWKNGGEEYLSKPLNGRTLTFPQQTIYLQHTSQYLL